MKIIYLKPLSGYATSLRSDTLWGMLCWGIRHLWGEDELKLFLKNCTEGNPSFVISSTFPCKKYGKDWIPFFPNPLPFPDEREDQVSSALTRSILRKQYKKVFKYLNFDDFKAVLERKLSGKDLYDRLFKIHQEENRLNSEATRTDKPKVERVISPIEIEQTAPHQEGFSMTHNTINRVRGGTLSIMEEDGDSYGQLFHSDEFYWSDKYADSKQESNTGIFFLADGPDIGKLEAVLHLFRHLGMGADRSTGKGFFDMEIREDFTFPTVSGANAMLNLSLFHPKSDELEELDKLGKQEINANLFQYDITLREGFVSTDTAFLRKNPHRYFKEGSVLPLLSLQQNRYLGKVIKQQFSEKKPAHDVFDNGFGFMVPLKWPE